MKRGRLAAAVVAGVFAFAAPVASAHEFHLGASPAIVDGAQLTERVVAFEANGGFSCTSASLQGTTMAPTVSELRLHPTYSGCALFGSAATITTTGCDYLLTGKTVETGIAQLTISCEAGKQIEVNWAAGCLLKLGTQTPERGYDAKNKLGSPPVVFATLTAAGIGYEATGSSCAFFAGKASLTGEFVIRAFADEKGKAGEGVSITLE